MVPDIFHILIIDDDEIDRMALKRSLRKAGLRVEITEAGTVDQAREKIATGPFDCVFLDYRMPGGNGVELLKEFRSNGYEIPVVVVTSHADPTLAVQVMKAGGSDFIPKEYLNPDLVGQVLLNAIRTTQAEQERKKAVKALRYSQARLAEAQRIAHLGHWELDLQSEEFECSDQFYELLGYESDAYPEEVSFVFIANHSTPSSVSRLRTALDKCIEERVELELDIQIKRKDQALRDMEIHFRPVIKMGLVARVRGTLQDITFRKKIEAQLTEAKDAAERSARAKEEFLANMSHEIRTPMNAMLGFAKLLQETPLNETQMDYLAAIDLSGEALLAIINDILDLSKIEAGQLRFESKAFSIRESLKSLQRIFKAKIDEKGLSLTTLIGPGVPDILIGDQIRLNQILMNLVGNAIKFTEEGQIDIEVKSIEESEEQVHLLFEVTDTGIGIPEEKQLSIFKSFTQASGETTRKYGGTGLGLTICKRIVELQGGRIGVHSEPGEGASFYFELNFLAPSSEDLQNHLSKDHQVQANTSSQSELNFSQLRILVAEDNPMNQLLVRRILEGMEIPYELAQTGLQALELVKLETFDLVLMDIQMPEMDGYEATRSIRQLPAPKGEIPIIALTAHAFAEEKAKCLTVGMNDFLPKPFQPDQLRQKLRQLLVGEIPSEVLPNAVNQDSLYDLQDVDALCAGKMTFKLELLELFLQEAPLALSKMENAIQKQDGEALRRAIHAFKPSVILLKIRGGETLILEMHALADEGKTQECIPLLASLTQTLELVFVELAKELPLLTL